MYTRKCYLCYDPNQFFFSFQIWGYFHLAANSKYPRFHKIYRSGDSWTCSREKFNVCTTLTGMCPLMTPMVPHQGRLSFKQYIKKQARREIKLWVLCEDKTDYVFNVWKRMLNHIAQLSLKSGQTRYYSNTRQP